MCLVLHTPNHGLTIFIYKNIARFAEKRGGYVNKILSFYSKNRYADVGDIWLMRCWDGSK